MQGSVETKLSPSPEADVRAFVKDVRIALLNGTLAPYLGPGVFPESVSFPTSYQELAAFFGQKVALPRRARGNLWASAQYVETNKHRVIAESIMAEAFAVSSDPLPIHRFFGDMPLPLVVDSWYDGAMRAALAKRSDWVEIQGVTRSGVGEKRWYRTYDPAGQEIEHYARVKDAGTILYKPHGAVVPAKNFLVSDADYVEVLTEIDIQTPIPEAIQERRSKLGFLYLGCRFHDQTLRIFARQIAKRSNGTRFAVVDEDIGLTPNERRFLRQGDVRVIVAPLREVCARIMQA